MSTDFEFIARTKDLAVESGIAGNRPFGAVFVAVDGTVLGEGRNEVASASDVTAHAELVAIREATAAGHHDRFGGSVMYASGEPCPMCAAACVWAGVRRIVFAASTVGFTAVLPDGPHFFQTCAELIAATDADVEVVGPVDEEAMLRVMRSVL